eukprot:6188001-Pleurochrysis_carterae.AAC.1
MEAGLGIAARARARERAGAWSPQCTPADAFAPKRKLVPADMLAHIEAHVQAHAQGPPETEA